MIIKAKPVSINLIRYVALFLMWFFRKRLNKLVFNNDINLIPNHSYILMCNHFGFIDGFFAYYLCFKWLNKKQKIKGLYTMSVKKQMEKNWWLKYAGSFSIDPGKRSIDESLTYAAELLKEPGNVLIYFPQGNLESCHVRNIHFMDGLYEITTRTSGNCQLIWCSNILEYFENSKPSIYFNFLDCGTNHQFDFESLKQKVNKHHAASLDKTLRLLKQ